MKIRLGEQIKYWYRKYIPEKIRNIFITFIPFWVQLRYFYLQTKKFDLEIHGHGEAKKLIELSEKQGVGSSILPLATINKLYIM